MHKKQAGAVLVKILGVVIGMVFVVVGVQEAWHVRTLKETGLTAVVEPVRGYTEHRSRGMSTYTAQISFVVADGRRFSARHSFPGGHIEDFKAGREVKVHYDPRDPSDYVFEKDGASWLLLGGGAAIAVAALIFG